MALSMIDPPFGTYALPGWAEGLRQASQRLGTSALARRAASLTRRVCLAGRSDPFDVEPFPGQRARLYPRDNLSEKRVFGAAQFWDPAERAALTEAVQATPAPFCFVDAGANVGLYSLAVRSAGPARILAIEPDGENRRRLADNLAASGARDAVIAPVALSDEAGEVSILVPANNRGETLISHSGGTRVAAKPLLDVIEQAGLPRVDALKIDIEGAEARVLTAFFHTAPPGLWPRLVLIEAQRGARTESLSLLEAKGYIVSQRTRMNAILTLPQTPPAPEPTGGLHVQT